MLFEWVRFFVYLRVIGHHPLAFYTTDNFFDFLSCESSYQKIYSCVSFNSLFYNFFIINFFLLLNLIIIIREISYILVTARITSVSNRVYSSSLCDINVSYL